MKKIYILAIVAFAFSFTGNAQVTDNFEGYSLGDLSPQSAHWATWTPGAAAEEGQVSADFASEGSQSLNIPNNNTTDMILLLGDKAAGDWTLQWMMYVPSGATGFWNYQQEEANPGGQFNGQVFVDATGSGGTAGKVTYDFDATETDYPNDAWFLVKTYIDLAGPTISIDINGASSLSGVTYTGTQIGSIDFFSIDANNNYYIDEVLFVAGPLGVDDFSADVFSVYPNPVKDVLNISSKTAVDSVVIYDVLGKVVLQAQPDTISPKINMSALSSGAYLVQVTIGNASKTIKVVK